MESRRSGIVLRCRVQTPAISSVDSDEVVNGVVNVWYCCCQQHQRRNARNAVS